jgi:hypothetical protein
MTNIGPYADYLNGSETLFTSMKSDLTKTVERLYSTQITVSPCQLLQSSKNSLRQSIEQLQDNGKPTFENDGQCRGAAEWFVALFLEFKRKYPEVPIQKIVALIAKEFEEGVGINGAYIQKNYRENSTHEKILQSLNITLEERSKKDLSYKDFTDNLLKELLGLQDGVYLLSFSGSPGERGEKDIPGHATAVVIERKNYFFFDPNAGATAAGPDVGSADKVKDASLMLAICQQYSPFHRTRECFQTELANLPNIIDAKQARIIQKVAKEITEEKSRVCLCAYGVHGVYKAFQDKGTPFTEAQKEALWAWGSWAWGSGLTFLHFLPPLAQFCNSEIVLDRLVELA